MDKENRAACASASSKRMISPDPTLIGPRNRPWPASDLGEESCFGPVPQNAPHVNTGMNPLSPWYGVGYASEAYLQCGYGDTTNM